MGVAEKEINNSTYCDKLELNRNSQLVRKVKFELGGMLTDVQRSDFTTKEYVN